MEIEVNMPPALGGGTFVMRELTAGEYEDMLRRGTRGVTGAAASEALIELQSEQIMTALVTFKGKPVPKAGHEREEFWRGLGARQSSFLKSIFDKLHFVPEQDVEDFFQEAVTVKAAKVTAS
jgi:hypothetical protein